MQTLFDHGISIASGFGVGFLSFLLWRFLPRITPWLAFGIASGIFASFLIAL